MVYFFLYNFYVWFVWFEKNEIYILFLYLDVMCLNVLLKVYIILWMFKILNNLIINFFKY